jgi:hypothetical protein
MPELQPWRRMPGLREQPKLQHPLAIPAQQQRHVDPSAVSGLRPPVVHRHSRTRRSATVRSRLTGEPTCRWGQRGSVDPTGLLGRLSNGTPAWLSAPPRSTAARRAARRVAVAADPSRDDGRCRPYRDDGRRGNHRAPSCHPIRGATDRRGTSDTAAPGRPRLGRHPTPGPSLPVPNRRSPTSSSL